MITTMSTRNSGAARNCGADIAKIVAMFFVVAVHVNGMGLGVDEMSNMGFGYRFARSVARTLFVSCIDIFAIISGYLGVYSSFKVTKMARLWFQVMITCTAVMAITALMTGTHLSAEQWIKSLMPVSAQLYWYMTCYFMLMLVTPFLNVGIVSLPQRTVQTIILLSMLSVCGMAAIGIKGTLGTNGGYSFEWIAILYLFGAYWRHYGFAKTVKRRCWLMVLVAVLLVGSLIPRIVSPRYYYSEYTSPVTLVIAISIVALCLRIEFEGSRIKRVVTFLATTSLGVYLVHCAPVFWNEVFHRTIKIFRPNGFWSWILGLMLFSLSFYVVGTLFEAIRSCVVSFAVQMIVKMRSPVENKRIV